MYNDVIYCLREENGDPFYVGRSKQTHLRHKQHIRSARAGDTEAKYQHIRNLWQQGKNFELIVLDDNPKARYEKYYHWLLGCEYDLTNQKMGDSMKIEQDAGKILREKGVTFADPQVFLTELDRVIAEEKARIKAQKVQDRIREVSKLTPSTSERTLYVGEKPNEKFISPGYRAIMEKRNGNKSTGETSQ